MLTEYEFIKVVDLYEEKDEEVINEEGKIENITLYLPICNAPTSKLYSNLRS